MHSETQSSADKLARFFVPCVVGLAIPVFVALAWSPDGRWSAAEYSIRDYAAVIVITEFFTILVAIREGLLTAIARGNWPRGAVIAAVVLALLIATTPAFAPDKPTAVILAVYWLFHGAFALALTHLSGRVFQPRDLVHAWMAGFAIFVIEFFLFIHEIPDWQNFDWKWGFMGFPHIRHAGYYLGAMAALSLGAMAVAETRREWWWSWLSAAFAFGIALWTGSRGAVFAVIGAVAVGMLLFPLFRTIRTWCGTLASMIAALIVVWIAPAAPYYLMGLGHAVQQTESADVTTGRTTIWKNVIGAIRHRPLFGYGDGQMREVAPFADIVQPHDSILQVTLAWGLAGLACVAVLAVVFLSRALPAVRREQGPLVPVFTAMTALAILSLYDGDLYYAFSTSIFLACGAVIASQWNVAVVRNTQQPEMLTPAPVR